MSAIHTRPRFWDWFDARICSYRWVYLNDKALYEVNTLAEVKSPFAMKIMGPRFYDHTCIRNRCWRMKRLSMLTSMIDPTRKTWDQRVKAVFTHRQNRLHYLKGFGVTKRRRKAPPTAYQRMVGPHWSKGWIIENVRFRIPNVLVSRLASICWPNNDNKWSSGNTKMVLQTERDVICQASWRLG